MAEIVPGFPVAPTPSTFVFDLDDVTRLHRALGRQHRRDLGYEIDAASSSRSTSLVFPLAVGYTYEGAHGGPFVFAAAQEGPHHPNQ